MGAFMDFLFGVYSATWWREITQKQIEEGNSLRSVLSIIAGAVCVAAT